MRRVVLVAINLLAAFTVAAHGATLVVRNTNDAGTESLRQRILEANPAGGDTIVFQIPTTAPGYNPTTGVFTIGLTSGELLIDKNLTIDGSAQKISIRRIGGTVFRIFRIAAGAVVTLNDLAISNGRQSSAAGIHNLGDLTLRNCTLYDNVVPLDSNQGGAIATSGTLRVSNCTFSGNSAIEGTAIYGIGLITIDNTTIFGNGAGNTAVRTENTATVRVRNTIIVAQVAGTFISEGYNLIGSQAPGTTGFGAMGDQLGVTAAQVNLGALQDNGGNTPTRRPLASSIAIDQGNRGVNSNGQPINTDQRGQPRPVDLPGVVNGSGDASDVGAVELGTDQAGPAFVVTVTAERNDGACTTDDCTLVEALNAANANPDANTIAFASGITGIITTDLLTPDGLTISNPVTINGPGARLLTISGSTRARIFRINAGIAVTMTGLTLRDGWISFQNAGGIMNFGNLTVEDCELVNNRSIANEPSGLGGAIYSGAGASLTLARCTLNGNAAGAFGGGVYSEGIFTATNCTVTGNSAVRGGGLISRFNGGAARMTLRNCTITGNTATDGVASPGFGGGGVFAEGNNTQYFASNNLIAGNNATNDPDIRGNYTSQGNNLIGKIGDATGFTNGINGDKVGTVAAPLSAQFGSFAANGGHTNTWSLLANSPAINAGNDALAPPTDQRGFGRNGISDIGAFEFNGPPPPVQLVRAISRKVHGSSGPFDIDLALSGTPTVECRSGGANGDYTVIFTFANNLFSLGSAAVTSGAGFVSSSHVGTEARQYVVNLSNIANAQRVTVTLFNVTDSLGYNSSSIPITFGILLGDTSGNGSVTATDIGQVKSQSGQPVTASNFRADVTASGGSINASDIGLVKSASGTQLP
jgi:hypothetical protein